MAATTQALEALSASLNERINGLGLRMNATDEGLQKYEQMITTQFIEMSTKFEKAISQPGDVVHNAIQAIVRDAHDQLLNRMVELEKKIEKKPEKSEHRWNIKDPKARGTVKFSGDKKDDVRAFTQWRKHAVIYLEKVVPNLGKFLTAYTAAKAGEVFDVAQELFNLDIDLNYAELDDIMHYFLFEHLTDSAADLVESCGDKGFAMWKMINQYYEPQSQSTHANIHAAVYEMARKKAKTPGEMHGLLREFEKRLVKLEQIKGTISDIAKASIVYNMMDDATQKTICDGGHNDDFEYMRLKIIREGCESRERSIVKNNKATPMEIDSLEGRDVPDPFLCEPTIGEVNAVTNPNIVCFICKEKGHIARQCPHNEGKNRMSNHSKGDDWWYAAKGGGKGKGQKGKSKGKGKYGNGKGAGRKGYGKAYSLENADDWEADWWLDNASNIGSIRSLERLSMLQHVKPVQTIVEEFEKAEFCTPRGSSPDIKVAIQKSEPKFKGKLKYKPTDSFNEALHNSISYNKMVEAFRHEEKAVIHKAKIIPAKIIPTTNSSEKKFNKEKKPKMKPTNGDKKKIIDIVEFENISDGIIEASLDAPPGWVVDSPEAQWEILKATLVPGYRTAEQRQEERRTAMAVEKYEEMRRKEASSTPADACSLTPNGVIGSHQVDHIGHSISELSGETTRWQGRPGYCGAKDPAQKADFSNVNDELIDYICGKTKKMSNLSMFNEVRGQSSICPVTGTAPTSSTSPPTRSAIDPTKWEVMHAVVDSGATVPVLHPKTGGVYQVEESPASRAGVEYEIANGSTLPCLGQKHMAVMTEEGTMRGYTSQCADVSKALQAVRSMVASRHAVCFGLGPAGEDHLIINRESGEINRMIDDGVNYLQKLFVVPPDQVEAVQERLQQAQDFTRRGE